MTAAWLETRTSRLEAYLSETDLSAVWFARPGAFAWLTGAGNDVDRGSDVGTAAAGYTEDGDLLVVGDAAGVERLEAEALPAAFTVERVPWYESTLPEAVAARTPTPAAADIDVPGLERVDPGPLRQPLTERDIERYRALGADVAAALESVCREVRAGDSGTEVAAGVRIALAARGIDTPVCLVGDAARATAFRQPTPTDDPLEGYATVSVTAERHGLYASASRTVAFDPPSWLVDRHEAAMRVEASALAATRAAARRGGTAGEVFDAVVDAYEAVGYPSEWREHHQGGAAGYAGREWVATQGSDRRVEAPMAYAWNPTVRGATSTDTVLVTGDELEVLTETGRWPRSEVAAVGADVTVARHAVLTE